jgi:hypothetical protein
MASATREFVITNGPNRLALVLSLLDVDDGRPDSPVFHLVLPLGGKTHAIRLEVQSMEMEDGSGVSWNIRGYFQEELSDDSGVEKWARFEAYYHSRNRRGRLTTNPTSH